MVRCTKEEEMNLDRASIVGIRENAYGAEVMIKKDAVPAGMESFPADLEDLFVLMVKGEQK